jgi:hypothetical protein
VGDLLRAALELEFGGAVDQVKDPRHWGGRVIELGGWTRERMAGRLKRVVRREMPGRGEDLFGDGRGRDLSGFENIRPGCCYLRFGF